MIPVFKKICTVGMDWLGGGRLEWMNRRIWPHMNDRKTETGWQRTILLENSLMIRQLEV